ncbi:PUB34 [Symbiodinium sp. CCMP2592]|nr:PUB34 [Symbiodinium sp. CCMP2592]
MRLRRCPDESSVTLAVYKEPIPQENGWLWVQKESKDMCGGSGIVDEKILVLEVLCKSLPTTCEVYDVLKSPDEAESVTRILDKHLRDDMHNMPMLVVEAHKPPHTSPAVRYILDKELQDKTVGIVSKCDLCIDNRDALRARILHEPSVPTDGSPSESPEDFLAHDLGAVRMKCWIASMQGPEKQGEERAKELETHNFERENAYFAKIPELQDLQEKGHAGVPCLVEKLQKEYLNHLHLSWKWDAFYKLEAKLDRLQFDLSLLGVVPEDQKEQLASAEALYQSFVTDVLGDGLFRRISDALLQFQGSGYTCEGFKQQSAIDRACAEIRKITGEALEAVSSHLVKPVREILETESKVTHAPECLGLEPLQAFEEGKRWKSMQQTLRDQPIIQLSSYATYTDAIMQRCETLHADAVQQLRNKSEELLKRLADLDAPSPWIQVKALFEPQGLGTSRSKVVMYCKAEEFAHAMYALFLRHIPSQDQLANLHEGLPVGEERAETRSQVDSLTAERAKVLEARTGIRDALSIDDEEFAEIQQKYEAAALLKPPFVAPTPSTTEAGSSSGEDSGGVSASSSDGEIVATIKVHCKSWASSFEMELLSEATVQDLKELIRAELGESSEQQLKLIFKGDTLEDARCVKDLGIAEDEFLVVDKAQEADDLLHDLVEQQ